MTLEFTYHGKNGKHVTKRRDVDMIIFRDVDVPHKMVMWDFKGGPVPDLFPKKISNPAIVDMTMDELDDMREREEIPVMILDVDAKERVISPRDGCCGECASEACCEECGR